MYPSDEPKKRKPRHKKTKKGSIVKLSKLGLFCRMIGSKGTDVYFYAVTGTDKVLAVFSDGNYPHTNYDPNTLMAHGGGNVITHTI